MVSYYMGKIDKLEYHIKYITHSMSYRLPDIIAYINGIEPVVLIGLDVNISKDYTEVICTYIDSKNVTHITNKIDNIFMHELKTKAARMLYKP